MSQLVAAWSKAGSIHSNHFI